MNHVLSFFNIFFFFFFLIFVYNSPVGPWYREHDLLMCRCPNWWNFRFWKWHVGRGTCCWYLQSGTFLRGLGKIEMGSFHLFTLFSPPFAPSSPLPLLLSRVKPSLSMEPKILGWKLFCLFWGIGRGFGAPPIPPHWTSTEPQRSPPPPLKLIDFFWTHSGPWNPLGDSRFFIPLWMACSEAVEE